MSLAAPAACTASKGVFDLYAACYDLLYRDKDYPVEAAYVAALVREQTPGAVTVLELGCGTGGHAAELVKLGFEVHGIDLSARMVAQAHRRAIPGAFFEEGDVRAHRAGRTFDAVMSLFHVMSYQTAQEDLAGAFGTARAHLVRGGAFVFDCWYGPAVLSDRPRAVVREVADDRVAVRRVTTPVMCVNDNVVEVNFDVQIDSRADGRSECVSEVHRMRYLFLPELRALLAENGFALVKSQRWLSDQVLDDRSWYACITAVAV